MAVFLQILLNAILSASLYALVAGGLSFLYATVRLVAFRGMVSNISNIRIARLFPPCLVCVHE